MTQNETPRATRMTATVKGYVQGVGFRWSTRAYAMTLNLRGVAENLMDGDVLVIAEGPEPQCRKLLEWLEGHGSRLVRRPGRVEAVEVTWSEPKGDFRSFSAR